MGIWTLVQAAVAALAGFGGDAPARDAELARMTPEQKAALVVVSGLPAPPGVGGVFVRGARRGPVPPGTLVFVDQEGGGVKSYDELPPFRAPSSYGSAEEAFRAGAETGRALREVGAHVDLAPVLDAWGGPLGSRHFRAPALGVAFARGLEAGGAAACVKHFPGLGSAPVSTDDRPHVEARVRRDELAAFRAAVRARVDCVMMGHAFYPSLGRFRASLEPAAYRLLRRDLGFRGLVVTDSMNIVAHPPAYWPARAIRSGADMLLYTSPGHARDAIRALVPLARAGELDAKVERVLRLRRQFFG